MSRIFAAVSTEEEMDMTLIRCTDVTMRYGGVTALSNVTFEIDRGDNICIVGPNGAGKSTLLKGLLGLRPLDSGKVEYIGTKRSEIGYLPQQTSVGVGFPASVRVVVLSGRLGRAGFRPFYNRADRAAARDALKRLGAEKLAYRPFGELSGGQRQRVLLARALAAADSLICLDEPVAGLDPEVTAGLYELIDRLNREGMAILMVSHDLDAALQRARKILHIDGGVRFFGAAEEYAKTQEAARLRGDVRREEEAG